LRFKRKGVLQLTDKTLEERISIIEEVLNNNDKAHDRIERGQNNIWDAVKDMREGLIEDLKKRPPIWCTFTMQFQTGMIGVLATAIIAVLIMYKEG